LSEQVLIISKDAVFARLLLLELQLLHRSCRVLEKPEAGMQAELILLDLDSAQAPSTECYGRMIGFTRHTGLFSVDAQRQCSMVLHRPFEMQLLRQEVLSQSTQAMPSAIRETLLLDGEEKNALFGERRVALSPKEAKVLSILLKNRGTPVSRALLSQCIGESESNKVDVYICFLRRKIEELCGSNLITTVRGKGYCIKE
jgi:hypothetical protein